MLRFAPGISGRLAETEEHDLRNERPTKRLDQVDDVRFRVDAAESE